MRVSATVLVLWLPLVGCTADLRPLSLESRTEPAHPQRARELLVAAAEAQHLDGADPWLEQSGVEVRLLDGYQGLFGFVARPWPENPQALTFRFRPGHDDGWLDFDSDGDREAWGLVDWNTWRRAEGGELEWGQDPDVTFWIPTLEYFLELPFRIGHDAEIVDDAGPADYEGQLCDRVYVTWESYEPGDLDQYLVWIRRSDGVVVRFDFTVRDLYDFVSATARYSEFRAVGGYLLPHRVEIGEAPPDDVFHVMQVESWTLDAEIPEASLAPGGAPSPRRKPR